MYIITSYPVKYMTYKGIETYIITGLCIGIVANGFTWRHNGVYMIVCVNDSENILFNLDNAQLFFRFGPGFGNYLTGIWRAILV